MAPSLSRRGIAAAQRMTPRVSNTESEVIKVFQSPGHEIDLSVAESWLLRSEVLDILREAYDSIIVPDCLALPKGVWGDSELLNLLAGMFNEHFEPHLKVLPSHIVTTAGASSSIDNLVHNLCDAGDGILVPIPHWGVIDSLVSVRSSVTTIPVNVGQDFLDALDGSKLIQALEDALKDSGCSIRALMLSSPQNPVGRCYPRDCLEQCVAFCERHDIHLMSDEVFGLSTFDSSDPPSPTFTSLLALDTAALGCDPDRLHVIWSFSKDLGMGGIRMGCTVSQKNASLRNAIALTASMQHSTLSNTAAFALLKSPRFLGLLALSSERLAANYRTLTTFLNQRQVEYVPTDAGSFMLAKLATKATTFADADAFSRRLEQAGVRVSTGRSLCITAAGWYRVGFGCSQRL